MNDDLVSSLLDKDFEGYELRALLNGKMPYYDKYEQNEARQHRKIREKERKEKKAAERAKAMRERAEKTLSPHALEDARKLRGIMATQGISHYQLADVIGIHHCSLSRWFNTPSEFHKHQEVIEQAISIVIEERKKYAN